MRQLMQTPRFTGLDWVRICWPSQDHKLLPFWSTTLQIVKQLGAATFRLSDESRWRANQLQKVALPYFTDFGVTGGWASIAADRNHQTQLNTLPIQRNLWPHQKYNTGTRIGHDTLKAILLTFGFQYTLVSAQPITWQNNPYGYTGN